MYIMQDDPVQWNMKLFVQNNDKVKQTHKLFFYPNLASQLLNILDVKLDLATATETDIKVAILQKQKSIVVIFDTFKYKFTDIACLYTGIL